MQVKADIIVIGAGIAGTSAAAALAQSANIIVLDQEAQAGYHSTGRSAATWAPYYGPDIIRFLTAASIDTLSKPEANFADQPFTCKRGEMMLGLEGDEAEIECHKLMGMDSLSLSDARALVPMLKDSVKHILYTDNMLGIDVDALHQAFIRKIKSNSSQIIVNQKVVAMEYSDNRWHINTATTDYQSPIVINAAGAWADNIAALAGVTPVGLQPKRRSAALAPYAEGENMPDWPMIFGAGESFYCTPFGNGMMISPADETPVDPHDVWPEDIDIATGIDLFQQHIDYDFKSVIHQWAGLRTFAPDGNPVVGFDNNLPGFFWLAGQGGYGIQTSPALAALCRELIYPDSGTSNGFFTEPEITDLRYKLSPARYNPDQSLNS